MSPWADALVVLVAVFASGLLGLYLRSFLPVQHLQEDSIGMVRLCTGVIATLAALVLGLLVASAKANYDRVNDDVSHAAASVVLLDRTLAQYGPNPGGAQLAAYGGSVYRQFGIFEARSRGGGSR